MAECHLRRAAMAANREDFAAALELAHHALSAQPGDPDAMVGRCKFTPGRAG
jgi:hypothetical protein